MTQNNERNRNGGNANQGGNNATNQADNNATNQGGSDVAEAVNTVGGGAAGAMVGSKIFNSRKLIK
jgi:hypothetical protein